MKLDNTFNKIDETRAQVLKPHDQIIAGDLTLNTRMALLMANAAEQTLRLVEKTQDILDWPKRDLCERPSLYRLQNKTAQGYIDVENSDLDEPRVSLHSGLLLARAAATWKVAQLNFNREFDVYTESYAMDARKRRDATFAPTAGLAAIPVLKAAAADFYQEASITLSLEGHADLAERLFNVSKSISVPETTNDKIRTPMDIVSAIHHDVLENPQEEKKPQPATVEETQPEEPQLELALQRLELALGTASSAAARIVSMPVGNNGVEKTLEVLPQKWPDFKTYVQDFIQKLTA